MLWQVDYHLISGVTVTHLHQFFVMVIALILVIGVMMVTISTTQPDKLIVSGIQLLILYVIYKRCVKACLIATI